MFPFPPVRLSMLYLWLRTQHSGVCRILGWALFSRALLCQLLVFSYNRVLTHMQVFKVQVTYLSGEGPPDEKEGGRPRQNLHWEENCHVFIQEGMFG